MKTEHNIGYVLFNVYMWFYFCHVLRLSTFFYFFTWSFLHLWFRPTSL